MVASVFALVTEFPNTTDFYRRLLTFNTALDFAKLTLFDDGRLAVLTWCPLRVVDKEQLLLMLDQVAAANNSVFDAFGKDAKQ
jgi:hypothetical protein